jgi:hypothetical protein
MQPYFLPYLGYFDLINRTDQWVIFDTVQYIRHGWINRNRILHPSSGWSYITVPVKASRETVIKEVKISNDGKWEKRIYGQLLHYKKRAPFFEATMELLEKILAHKTDSISELNVFALHQVCSYLGIRFDYKFFSDMKIELENIEGPGDWALQISKALGASEYINPPGGRHLFNDEKFSALNIKLIIQDPPTMQYDCPGYEFIPGLSILDVLMWNSPNSVKQYLDNHKSEQENE